MGRDGVWRLDLYDERRDDLRDGERRDRRVGERDDEPRGRELWWKRESDLELGEDYRREPRGVCAASERGNDTRRRLVDLGRQGGRRSACGGADGQWSDD